MVRARSMAALKHTHNFCSFKFGLHPETGSWLGNSMRMAKVEVVGGSTNDLLTRLKVTMLGLRGPLDVRNGLQFEIRRFLSSHSTIPLKKTILLQKPKSKKRREKSRIS